MTTAAGPDHLDPSHLIRMTAAVGWSDRSDRRGRVNSTKRRGCRRKKPPRRDSAKALSEYQNSIAIAWAAARHCDRSKPEAFHLPSSRSSAEETDRRRNLEMAMARTVFPYQASLRPRRESDSQRA